MNNAPAVCKCQAGYELFCYFSNPCFRECTSKPFNIFNKGEPLQMFHHIVGGAPFSDVHIIDFNNIRVVKLCQNPGFSEEAFGKFL